MGSYVVCVFVWKNVICVVCVWIEDSVICVVC